jgi:transposase
MLSLPASVQIYLCVSPTDMRRGFDGLAQIVRDQMGGDPLSGHLFVFRNRRGDRMKILYWDRDGLALWQKRLERGTFRFPRTDGNCVMVTAAELTMILEGIDLASARRLPRYVHGQSTVHS